MIYTLARNWWLLTIRGVLAIIFGILAIAWPALAFEVLVILYGAYALVNGAFALASAVTGLGSAPWWALLLEGIAGIAIGIITFTWPGLTAEVLVLLIAIWFMVTGVFEVVAAFMLRKVITGELWMVLSGLLSIIFGVIAFTCPLAGAVAIGLLVGIYALSFGVLLLALSFRLRRWHRETPAA